MERVLTMPKDNTQYLFNVETCGGYTCQTGHYNMMIGSETATAELIAVEDD
jgi:hypothetical protein